MKKLLLGITVLALILFASSAMAGGPKVPKTLCLDYATFDDYHMLYFKSLGNMPSSDGNIKMYSMSGYNGIFGHPIHGSGYVAPNQTILKATYNAQGDASSHRLRSYELYFDLTNNTGTVYYTYSYADGTSVVSSSDTVTGVSCSTLGITSAMTASGANASDSQ